MGLIDIDSVVLLPTSGATDIDADFLVVGHPTPTFEIDFENGRLKSNLIEGLDAMRQAVRLILSTERYWYPAHRWTYGVELVECFGQPTPLVYSMIETAITEALMQDDRITNVDRFSMAQNKKVILCQFTVTTTEGEFVEIVEVEADAV